MNGYELAPEAALDLEEILSYTDEHRGSEAADNLQNDLIAAFERLVVTPGIGHRRRDLTLKLHLFYPVGRYLVVYTQGVDPLGILRILHSSRDIRRLLKSRRKPRH